MQLLRGERGRIPRLAKELGLTRSAIHQWDRIPAERVVEVERITGIKRELLRPDLFEREAAMPAVAA
jgi:DNA-binding transcriptional regulator YdaS (Cro superfamily)